MNSQISQIRVSFLLIITLGIVAAALAQTDNARRFWPPDFRPPAASPTPKQREGNYHTVTGKRPAQSAIKISTPATIGITLWLLTPEQPATGKQSTPEDVPRLLVKKQKDGQTVTKPMLPQRVNSNRPFRVGEELRLSVEVPQDGYLYVIDRERYEGGKLGAPYLIFPSNPESDENMVKAGRIIDLPTSGGSFEIRRMSDSNLKLIGESLVFIVTREPLTGFPRPDEDGNIRLREEQVAEWENKWAKNVRNERLELAQGAGKYRTQAEQKAIENSAQISQADPLPQTVYRLSVKQGSPFLVKFPLTIR
jgi:hypothetical protein